ncbi:hypothetical protein [Streptomyces anulatus]|uniref:hypothetical protein n=1 Tax=Streptomyces anulatus TaxID=1892 RepID=UPI001D196792|nr:hypothetical protein [Streptomyces anulatus]
MDIQTVITAHLVAVAVGVALGAAVAVWAHSKMSKPKYEFSADASERNPTARFDAAMCTLERLSPTIGTPQKLTSVLKSDLWDVMTEIRFTAPEPVLERADAYAKAVNTYIFASYERRPEGNRQAVEKAVKDLEEARKLFAVEAREWAKSGAIAKTTA